jgi:hypothetical protein
MTKSEQNDESWIGAVAQNYKHESASPFELNIMEAKIRRELKQAPKAGQGILPTLAAICSLLLLLGAIAAQTQLLEHSNQDLASVEIEEPTIQLFSNYDVENDHETYLPDDYITISQVMFD